MTKLKLSGLAVVFSYLSIRVWIEISSNSFVPIDCDLDSCIAYLQGSQVDAASYFRAAKLLEEANLIHLSSIGDQMWYFRLWPPGMALTHFMLSSFAGGSGFLIPLYGLLVVIIWTAAFWLPLLLNRANKNLWLVLCSFVVIIASPQFQSLFTGTQFFGSEPISLGLFWISIYLLFFSINSKVKSTKQMYLLLSSGIIMGLAAYFRAVFDFIILGTLGLSAGIAFVVLVIFGFRNLYTQNIKGISWVRFVAISLIWGFSAFAVTIPWRFAVYLKVSPGAFTFAPAGDRIWINDWLPTYMWADPAFPNKYGINGLCQAFVEKCNEISATELSGPGPYTGNGILTVEEFRNQALGAIAQNPFKWLASRLDFAIPQLMDGFAGSILGVISLVFTAVALVVILVFITAQWRKQLWPNIFFVFAIFFMLLLTVVPLFMSSFEPRYFFPLIFGIWTLFICAITISDYSAVSQKIKHYFRVKRHKSLTEPIS